MKNDPSEILIPKAAIRTMDKDLNGIVFDEWEETLAEPEVSDILKNLKNKVEQKNIVTPSSIDLETQKKFDEEKQAALDSAKRKEEERREAERKEMEKLKMEKLAEENREKEIVNKIRQKAVEMETIVKDRMKEDTQKYEQEEELKRYAIQEEQKEASIKLKIKEIEESLVKLPERKKPLDETKSFLFKERDRIQQLIDPIAESERKIEANIDLVAKVEEGSAIPLEKRRAEKERQMLETEREKVEQSRWGYEKDLFAVEEKLKELELQYQELAATEAKLIQQKKELADDLSKIDKRKERKQKEELIDKLVEEKAVLSKERDSVTANQRELEEKLAEIATDEKKIEKETEYLRHEEEVAKGLEKQKIEMERQRLQSQRTELEKKRWRIEDEKRKINVDESRLNIQYKNLLEKENLLRQEIDDINKLLGIVSKDTPKSTPKPTTTDKEASTEVRQRTGEYVKKYGPSIDEYREPTEPGLEDEETKLAKEALKRIEEKREKDALLKKLDAQNQTRENKRDQLIMERLKGTDPSNALEPKETDNPPVITPPPPTPGMMYQEKQPKPWIKFVVLGLIAIILIILIIFAIFKIRRPDDGDDGGIINPTSTPPIATTTPPVVKPEMWSSLIPNMAGTNSYIISQNSEIPVLLGKIYEDQIGENQFVRIIFENRAQNEYTTLNDLLEGISLKAPSGLNDAVNDEFTMYVYRNQGKQMIGWVAQRKLENNKDLNQIMSTWETDLGKNAVDLGYVLKFNKKGPCTFSSQAYKENSLRACNLVSSPGCYGACYAVTNNYLIYSTCCSSVTTLISVLEK